MTAPHFAWAIEQGRQRNLPSSERLVLMVLAERANGSRVCWPSLPTIAKDTGLSPRTVHTVVHRLEARALLWIEHRGREMHYHINRPVDPVPNGHSGNGVAAGPLQPLQSSVRAPLQPLQDSAPQPLQPLQESPPPSLQPLQPLQTATLATDDIDPCNSAQNTLATVASKSLKKESPKESLKHSRASAREGRVCDSGFDQFWDSYPRKVGKGQAQRAWGTAIGKASADQILLALAGAQWASDPRYIPHPATWLNGERWLDEVDDFDPVLRAVGLSPADFLRPGGLLQ